MSSASEAADLLVRVGVNLVAVDFDQTLISYHTGGKWPGGPEELVQSVRDVFKQLFHALVDRDVCLAIVTFSGQTLLISEVIRQSFPAFSDRIVIRCRDNSWGNPGVMSKDGKQKHMASAATELAQMTGKTITRDTTVLIDDDPNNIQIALNNNVRAVFFDPHKPTRLFDDIKELANLQFPPAQHDGFQQRK